MIINIRVSGSITNEIHVPKTLKTSDKACIVDILDELDIAPDQVVVHIDDEPVPITRRVRMGDTLEIVFVSSAG